MPFTSWLCDDVYDYFVQLLRDVATSDTERAHRMMHRHRKPSALAVALLRQLRCGAALATNNIHTICHVAKRRGKVATKRLQRFERSGGVLSLEQHLRRSWHVSARARGSGCYVGGPIDTSPHIFIVSNHAIFTMLLLARVWVRFLACPKSLFVKNAFAYLLSEMSQIVSILCNTGHVRIHTRTAPFSKKGPTYQLDPT